MGFVFILIMLTAAALLAIRSPRAALLTVVFLAPWGGLQADLGISLYAFQLVLLPLAVVTLYRSLDGTRVPIAAGGFLALFVVYAVVLSFVVIGFLPDSAVAGGALRGPTPRAITQVFFFLFSLSPVVVVPLIATRDDMAACGRVFLASNVVLAVIGWGQLFIWYRTGTNPIDVSRISAALGGNDNYSHEGLFDFAKLSIYRMNSLAGEPRSLGVSLVMAMLIIQSVALTTRRPRAVLLSGLWLFFLVSTLATYSTSAAAVWLLGSALQLPAMWVTRVRSRRSATSLVAVALIVAAPIVGGAVLAEASGLPVIDLLSERTIDRLDANGAVEDFDLAIGDYLLANPGAAITGSGLGNIHLYATAYLDPVFAEYAQGSIFTAKGEYLRLVSETGIIGFALFLLWFVSLVFRAAAGLRTDLELAALVPVAVLTGIVFMARTEIVNEFWLTAGLLVAGARQRQAGRALCPAAALA